MPKLYRLTKKEIGDAIVNYIGIYLEGVGFFPHSISDTDEKVTLPDSVTFHLEYIPKGTLVKEVKHAL